MSNFSKRKRENEFDVGFWLCHTAWDQPSVVLPGNSATCVFCNLCFPEKDFLCCSHRTTMFKRPLRSWNFLQHSMIHKPTIMQKWPPRCWKYLQATLDWLRHCWALLIWFQANIWQQFEIDLILECTDHTKHRLQMFKSVADIKRKVDHAKTYFELVAILRLLAISSPDASNYDGHRSVYYYRPLCTLGNWWEKIEKTWSMSIPREW